jgi:hypothetical protein
MLKSLAFVATLFAIVSACQTPAILTPNGKPVDPCSEQGTGHRCLDGGCCRVEVDYCGDSKNGCPAHSCCDGAGSGDFPFGARKKHEPTPETYSR